MNVTGGPRICVYHPTMGETLAGVIKAARPDAVIEIVPDTRRDPPNARQIDILIANTFPAGLLQRCPRLRWLHLTGTGVEHVAVGDPPAGLLVTNSASVPPRAVAEFVWMGLLALTKDAVALVDQQRAGRWQLPQARLVAGTRMVLAGLGRIGAEVARRAAAFDVAVTAVTRSGRGSPLVDRVVTADRLGEVVADADHLVLALPDQPETRNLINRAVIDRLPPHAVLINVGRAAVLDTTALVAALREQRLRGALLDVHDVEPLAPADPLWSVPGLWVTPHGAYRFPQEEREVARVFVENLAALLSGRPMPDQVVIT